MAILLILNMYCSAESGTGLGVGETIPNPEITAVSAGGYDRNVETFRMHDYKDGMPMLIAFMPSVLSEDKNSYAEVMISAFDTYFAQGFSFRSFKQYQYANPDMKIIIVTPESKENLQKYMENKYYGFEMVSDPDMHIANLFGVSKWNAASGSYVYVVDRENKITYADYDYRGQGEKLKSVQLALYTQFGLEENTNGTAYSPQMIGDKARDFKFTYTELGIKANLQPITASGSLSDYLGKKKVLIAFYPAAFSVSCSFEASAFNHWAEDRMLEKVKSDGFGDDLEILMVSVSNPLILSAWKNDLSLENVKLVNDNGGEISRMYNSFNSLGYNSRTVFLVDKDGKISYINWNYNVDGDDFSKLKEQVLASN